MPSNDKSWKTVASISAGLGIFFVVSAAGQYAFTKSQIYSAAERELMATADDAVSTVLSVVRNGAIEPAQLDKASFAAPNYIVVSSDGLLQEVYLADKSNRIPGGIVGEVVGPSGDFSSPAPYKTRAGDTWTVLIKPLVGGYVILSISETSGVVTPKELLLKNAVHFWSVDGRIRADVNLIENSVDYAVVDSSNTVTYAAGSVVSG